MGRRFHAEAICAAVLPGQPARPHRHRQRRSPPISPHAPSPLPHVLSQLTACRRSCRRCSSRAARLPQYTSIRNPPAILNSMFVVFSLNDPTPSSYTSHQIHQLLHCRLSLAAPSCGRAGIFEERALDFCARKCAVLTGGDFRRCLDFCRHALAASLQRQQQQGGSALAHVSSSFVFITVHNCNMSSRLAWLI